MPTTTEITWKYLSEHPSIKDCLKSKVINYSKLSRKIAKELGIERKTSIEAILIACRRYAEKLKLDRSLEGRILTILRKSELVVQTKIITVIVDKRIYLEHLLELERKLRTQADTFMVIEGIAAFTIITCEKHLDQVRKLFGHNLLKLTQGLALITIRSPAELETTPGVVSYLCSLLAERGINIVETMSCWTDTMFVVREEDAAAVMGFLKF